ncbi:hypothetical protein N7490_003356 [Penicillium lividum]|nr:hypothetical protein N7490_003356 [Penicillium lividum]
MSRNFFTAVVTIGVGVFTGYYTFQPALQEFAVQKAHGQQTGSSPDASATKQGTSISTNDTPTASPKPVAPESSELSK